MIFEIHGTFEADNIDDALRVLVMYLTHGVEHGPDFLHRVDTDRLIELQINPVRVPDAP